MTHGQDPEVTPATARYDEPIGEGDLTVYHDDDFVLALLLGGPRDGTQVHINVQTGLTMSEGRALLPPDLHMDGDPAGSGYRAWTIMDGKARYRWYESAEARKTLV